MNTIKQARKAIIEILNKMHGPQYNGRAEEVRDLANQALAKLNWEIEKPFWKRLFRR